MKFVKDKLKTSLFDELEKNFFASGLNKDMQPRFQPMTQFKKEEHLKFLFDLKRRILWHATVRLTDCG